MGWGAGEGCPFSEAMNDPHTREVRHLVVGFNNSCRITGRNTEPKNLLGGGGGPLSKNRAQAPPSLTPHLTNLGRWQGLW